MTEQTKILFLAISPQDSTTRLDKEVRGIEEKLNTIKLRNQFVLEQQWVVGVNEMQECLLRHNPNILHFSGRSKGQGGVNSGTDEGKLPEEAIAELIGEIGHDIWCVLLSACYTENLGKAINKHVRYVVGMSHEISDIAAIEFSKSFYQGLGFDKSVEEAFNLGRNQIKLNNLGEEQIPKLHKPKRSTENTSAEQNQTYDEEETFSEESKVHDKQECLKMVSREIENLLEPPSAEFARRAIAKSISEGFEENTDEFKDNPKGIAKFIINLHDGDSPDDVITILEQIFIPAISKLAASNELYADSKRDPKATNEKTKELFYLLLGWMVHLAVLDEDNVALYKQSPSFDIFQFTVSTKVAVEIFLARFSARSAVFEEPSHPKKARGQGGLEVCMNEVVSEDAKNAASKIVLDLWNEVYPDVRLEKKFELNSEELNMLAAKIRRKKGAKKTHHYVVSKVGGAFNEVALALCTLIPDLVIVGFGKEDNESFFAIEEDLAASIQIFFEELEEVFPLEVNS